MSEFEALYMKYYEMYHRKRHWGELWKQTAKDNREDATQRKELLVKADAYYRHSGGCPCCEMIFENVYRHTADCELARELRDG